MVVESVSDIHVKSSNQNYFGSSHRLSIWGENEEEEELENLEEALESFCDVSMRALKEQH